MNIEEFLDQGGSDTASLVKSVKEIVGCADNDTLLAVGSLAEGMGNRKSDLDLLLVTSRAKSALPDRDEIIWRLGDCVVDLRLFPYSTIEQLVTRLAVWSSQDWNTSEASDFTVEERVLLHRLIHGVLLQMGEKTANVSAIQPQLEDMVRLKLHAARHASRTVQVDMAGYRESQDYVSLGFASQKLLGHAIDALLAIHHLTNPLSKWRSRNLGCLDQSWSKQLAITPPDMSAVDFFWHLHRLPKTPEKGRSLGHAHKISSFARAVFASAEDTLVYKAGSRLVQSVGSSTALSEKGRALSPLTFDTDFVLTATGAKVSRLNEFEEALEFSIGEFVQLLLLDASMSKDEMETRMFAQHAIL